MIVFTASKRLGGLLALFLLFVAAPVLRADTLTWDWSFTGTNKTPPYIGAGTITADTNPSGGYTITAITGTWNTYTIDALLPPNSYAGNDNQITSSGDLDGISFTVLTPSSSVPVVLNDIDWNIKTVGNHIQATGKVGGDTQKGDFVLTLESSTSPVPEPSSVVLLGTALMAIGGLVWYRKQNPASVTAA